MINFHVFWRKICFGPEIKGSKRLLKLTFSRKPIFLTIKQWTILVFSFITSCFSIPPTSEFFRFLSPAFAMRGDWHQCDWQWNPKAQTLFQPGSNGIQNWRVLDKGISRKPCVLTEKLCYFLKGFRNNSIFNFWEILWYFVLS